MKDGGVYVFCRYLHLAEKMNAVMERLIAVCSADEKAEIVVDGQKVKNITGKKVGFNSLPDEWKTYADENELLDKKREMTLSSIPFYFS